MYIKIYKYFANRYNMEEFNTSDFQPGTSFGNSKCEIILMNQDEEVFTQKGDFIKKEDLTNSVSVGVNINTVDRESCEDIKRNKDSNSAVHKNLDPTLKSNKISVESKLKPLKVRKITSKTTHFNSLKLGSSPESALSKRVKNYHPVSVHKSSRLWDDDSSVDVGTSRHSVKCIKNGQKECDFVCSLYQSNERFKYDSPTINSSNSAAKNISNVVRNENTHADSNSDKFVCSLCDAEFKSETMKCLTFNLPLPSSFMSPIGLLHCFGIHCNFPLAKYRRTSSANVCQSCNDLVVEGDATFRKLQNIVKQLRQVMHKLAIDEELVPLVCELLRVRSNDCEASTNSQLNNQRKVTTTKGARDVCGNRKQQNLPESSVESCLIADKPDTKYIKRKVGRPKKIRSLNQESISMTGVEYCSTKIKLDSEKDNKTDIEKPKRIRLKPLPCGFCGIDFYAEDQWQYHLEFKHKIHPKWHKFTPNAHSRFRSYIIDELIKEDKKNSRSYDMLEGPRSQKSLKTISYTCHACMTAFDGKSVFAAHLQSHHNMKVDDRYVPSDSSLTDGGNSNVCESLGDQTCNSTVSESLEIQNCSSNVSEPLEIQTCNSNVSEPLEIQTCNSNVSESLKIQTRNSTVSEPLKIQTCTSNVCEVSENETCESYVCDMLGNQNCDPNVCELLVNDGNLSENQADNTKSFISNENKFLEDTIHLTIDSKFLENQSGVTNDTLLDNCFTGVSVQNITDRPIHHMNNHNEFEGHFIKVEKDSKNYCIDQNPAANNPSCQSNDSIPNEEDSSKHFDGKEMNKESKNFDNTTKKLGCLICGNEFECKKDLARHFETAHFSLVTLEGDGDEGNLEYVFDQIKEQKSLNNEASLLPDYAANTPTEYQDLQNDILNRAFIPVKRQIDRDEAKISTEATKQTDYQDFQNYTLNKTFVSVENQINKDEKKTSTAPRRLLSECEICGRRLKGGKKMLNSHMKRIHNINMNVDEDVYYCKFCLFRATSLAELNKHRLEKHGKSVSQQQCETCGKFFSSSYIQEHVRVMHGSDRRYKCEFCDMKFFDKKGRRNHVYYEHNNKEWKCEKCILTFKKYHQLRQHHIKVHSTKEFKCEKCSKIFKRKGDLTTHIKRNHEKVYDVCHICKKQYSSGGSKLRAHLMKFHGLSREETYTKRYARHKRANNKLQIQADVSESRKISIKVNSLMQEGSFDKELKEGTQFQIMNNMEIPNNEFENDKVTVYLLS